MFYELRPMLEVDSLPESIAFYENILGFACTAQIEGQWATLTLGETALMLTPRRSSGKPLHFSGSLYFYTRDVSTLWETVRQKVEIAYPLEKFEYGMHEFACYDCNGYLLQFGEEL